MTQEIVAVDFDGTIAEDAYPKIGKAQMFAFETLKKMQEDGYRLILWTYRSGDRLKEAVEFCRDNGVEFYAINNSFEGEEYDPKNASRKINADWFIDDRNVGGFPGWGEVYHMLKNKTVVTLNDVELPQVKKKKRGFFGL